MKWFDITVLLRALNPKDKDYPFGQLLEDTRSLLNLKVTTGESLNQAVIKYYGLPKTAEAPEVREKIQEMYIHDRSTLSLQGLRDGFNLSGT